MFYSLARSTDSIRDFICSRSHYQSPDGRNFPAAGAGRIVHTTPTRSREITRVVGFCHARSRLAMRTLFARTIYDSHRWRLASFACAILSHSAFGPWRSLCVRQRSTIRVRNLCMTINYFSFAACLENCLNGLRGRKRTPSVMTMMMMMMIIILCDMIDANVRMANAMSVATWLIVVATMSSFVCETR